MTAIAVWSLCRSAVDRLRSLRARNVVIRAAFLIAVLLLAAPSIAQTVQHIYDENGRLAGTIAPNGEGARWSYDAAGNITRIGRFTASQVSIIEFTPNGGPIGSSVTIWGTGFSATAAQNTVRFNGVTATVSTATVNQLVVVVPASATTGAISITSPNGSTTSGTNYTVGAAPAAPSITTLSPTTLRPGNTLTINGAGFSTTAAENRVRINGNFARVTAATATQLQVAVASVHMGGKVSMSTPQGSVTSAADVYAVPEAYVAGTVESTVRIVPGTPSTITFGTANRIALALFEGTRGQRLRYRTTAITGGLFPSPIEIYSPDGERIHSAPNGVGSQLLSEPLPRTGTYTLYIANGGTTGSMTVVLDVMSAALAIDGAATNYSWASPAPDQTGFVFTGVRGARLGLGVAVSSLTGNVAVTVFEPTGRLLADSGAFSGPISQGISLDLPPLVVPGEYLVVVSHAAGTSGSLALTLSNDATGTLTPGAAATALAVDRAGKNGRFSFTGQTGESFSVASTVVSGLSQSVGVGVRILKPNGGELPITAVWVNPGPTLIVDSSVLPVGGTYTFVFSPIGVQTGSANIQLQKTVTGVLTEGVASPFNLAAAQNARFTFTPSGSTNLNFGVGANFTSVIPAGSNITLTVRNAAGATVASIAEPSTALSLNLPGLVSGQAYSVEIDASSLATIAGSVLVTRDKTGTLTLDGAGTDFLSDGIGQNGRYSFSLASPPTRNWGLGVTTNVAIPGNGFLNVQVVRPSGTVFASNGLSGPGTSGLSFDLAGVSEAGTWTVVVDPTGATTPNLKLTLSSDIEEPIAVNSATPKTFAITAPGRNARYSFAGTLNRRMSLVVTALSGYQDGVNAGLFRQSTGAQVGATQALGPVGAVLYFDLLPGTENYVLFLSPVGGRTGSVSVRLLESQEFAVSPGGAPTSFTPAYPGQVGRFSFSTSASPTHLGRGALVTTPSASGNTAVRSFGPSGELCCATSFATQTAGSGDTGDFNNLTVIGQYAVELRPDAGGTPALQFTLSADQTGSITPGGPQITFNTTRSGQNGRYTFSATAGQRVNLTVNSGGSWSQVFYIIQRPDFSTFQFPAFGATGGTFLSNPLDVSGTWTLYVTPTPPSTGSVTFGISLQ